MATLIPFEPPSWAKGLKRIPKHRIQFGRIMDTSEEYIKLANPDTPIDEWNIPGIPETFRVSIKRDDMTGSTLSGNKVRKLEFLLADAVSKKCRHVITCGGLQSNHCRATAIAARQLGLQTHLVMLTNIEEKDFDTSCVKCEGNVLLNRLVGAKMYILPKEIQNGINPKDRARLFAERINPVMEQIVSSIKAETNEDTYVMPRGGSNEIGVFGYFVVFQEMIAQGIHDNFTDIVFTCGSGGMAAGLGIANHLTGGKLKCHAFVVLGDTESHHRYINHTLDIFNITDVRSPDIIDIIEGYGGLGYGISTDEEIEFIMEIASTTGIMLDPVYTGKAAKGFVHEMNTNPERFKGRNILFMHSGGIFSLYNGKFDLPILKSNFSEVRLWKTMASTKE